MTFVCQKEALNQLEELSRNDRHSVLIEGVPGCGKTYLAKQYAKMLNISDFQVIDSTVNSIRESIEACYTLSTPVVLCIENLDSGVAAASYALLKFLEEPASNVYIVVTCSSMYRVPDTIVSRSVCVVTSPPVESDIEQYASHINFERFHFLEGTKLWKCIRAFKHADIVLNMSNEQLEYFNKLDSVMKFEDTVSNLIWKLGHYEDNTETPLEIVISYIVKWCNSSHIRQSGIQCIKELSSKRIASHAVLAKFAFECKYKE